MKKIILILLFFQFNTLFATELVEPTRKIKGLNITYNYTSERSYNVKFEEAGISYRYLSGSKPNKWWGPFPYKAFEIEKNVFYASWFEKDYDDFVTLLINLNNKLLYGSAILSGETVHFHGAKITTIIKNLKD